MNDNSACDPCGKRRPQPPYVSIALMGAPAADEIVLPAPLTRLVEIAKEKLAELCVCPAGEYERLIEFYYPDKITPEIAKRMRALEKQLNIETLVPSRMMVPVDDLQERQNVPKIEVHTTTHHAQLDPVLAIYK